VPVHRELRAILDEAKGRRSSPVIVTNSDGEPYTQAGFQGSFFKLIRRLTKEGKIIAGLSFHGLRHTVGTKLAESGCDAQTIAAVLGHKTTAMAEHYSRHANRGRLARAAVAKLERDWNKKRKTATTRVG
jgi:integrase